MTDEIVATRATPLAVIVAVILAYVTGLVGVVVGTFTLLSRYDVPDAEVLSVSLLGSGIILLGLLTIGVASGLSRGSRLARLTVTAYIAVWLVLNFFTILTAGGWGLAAVVQIVIEVLLLIGMWVPPGSRFFARSSATRSHS